MGDALHLLGLARKAGRLQAGEEPAGALCRAGKAKLLLLAADAAGNTARRAERFTQAGNVPLVRLPFSKEELGRAVGRSNCALAALSDAGLAASLLKTLARDDPESYGAASQVAQSRAEKARRRQLEKRRHEKNVAQGKRGARAARPKADVDEHI
ncbi:MAG: ribosomal L7Ae/L30e/S12e/Gadd45 family protein [Oscillospiraceae bacterium]|nr:ribosomal L7Ae/L30e/S12e/Gadd45 family protein [Oscillospiraceae bacterium]